MPKRASRRQPEAQGSAPAPGVIFDEQTIAILRAQLDRWRARLTTSLAPRRDAFMAFHVDKPMVDYIHVESDQRRRGLAKALYQEGADWMAERGLLLHVSGIQTDAARAVWEAMRRAGHADLVSDQKSLDAPHQVLLSRKNQAGSVLPGSAPLTSKGSRRRSVLAP